MLGLTDQLEFSLEAVIDLNKNELFLIVVFRPPESAEADSLYFIKIPPSNCDSSGTCQYSINIFGISE